MTAESDWLRLGTLMAPWGVRGEITIHLDADPAYARTVTRAYLGADHRPVAIRGFFERARRHTLALDGVTTPEDAARLRGTTVFLRRDDAPPLPAGHYFVQDIVGLRVRTTDGDDLGRITDVLQTGANDVYVVHHGTRETLIPAIGDVVSGIDVDAGIVTVTVIPGLLE